MSRIEITASLELIFQGIARLTAAFPHRGFTIDGRLVGDIGEVIAALEYDVILDEISRPTHDGTTPDGRNVQIKATFKKHLTIRSIPDYYLGFLLFSNGEFEEVYNGPGRPIAERYAYRKGFGTELLSFPVAELRKLSAAIPDHERISVRARCSAVIALSTEKGTVGVSRNRADLEIIHRCSREHRDRCCGAKPQGVFIAVPYSIQVRSENGLTDDT
jgi:hypothetical protein